MAKPRVFVSSTYYDLRHIRDRLEEFIESLGFEPVLFEHGDIPFDPDQPLDESCYQEIETCHVLVLVVGGRYGSPASGESRPEGSDLEKMYAHYNSITKKEFESARRLDVPVYIIVDGGVLAEYETYKRNRDNTGLDYAHVDSVNVFRLLDEIFAQARNNPVKGFEDFDDIASWLREQWSGLFASYLSKRGEQTTLKDMTAQLADLREVAGTLREYTEALMRGVKPEEAQGIIAEQQERLDEKRRQKAAADGVLKRIAERAGKSPEELVSLLETSSSAQEFVARSGGRITPTRWEWMSLKEGTLEISSTYAPEWYAGARAQLGLPSSNG